MATSTDCIDTLRSIGATCASVNQVGGVNKRLWITQLGQIASYTYDADGYVNTISMGTDNSSDSYKLITVTGKKFTHNGTLEGVVGNNVNLIKHNAIVKIYTDTPAQRDAVTALFKGQELVVFFENENGKIEIYGLDKGLEASALAGGTGVALQDDNGITLTLSGEQTKLPEFFLVGGALATSVAYLDNISETI
jgi:hypothetical protein